MKTAVLIVSGGLDSTVLAYHYAKQGYRLSLISFDYGQRHSKELKCAQRMAARLEAEHQLVDLSTLRNLLPGSSLTDDIDVPDGHYAAENMKSTVVPNRNAIMLAIAWGHAVAIGADVVAFGAHGGDHFIYPDCRPEFFQSAAECFTTANTGFGKASLRLEAPFLGMTKTGIVGLGDKLGVPFEDTWSCYKGDLLHCGTCGTCVERKEAFEQAAVVDPTDYEVG